VDSNYTVWRAFALAGQFGVTLGVCVAGGVILGEKLDATLGTTPLFILVCIFAGIALGTVGGIQLIRLSLERRSR
jgi:F0F1-type ATP synthase assembly protein I